MPKQPTEPEHFQALAALYLSHATSRLSYTTFQRRQADINQYLLPFFDTTSLYDITATRIRRFREAMAAQGLSDKHSQQLLVTLRACLKYAVRMSWLNVLPWPQHKVVDNMALTLDMPNLSALEFKGLYADLMGDMQGQGQARPS